MQTHLISELLQVVINHHGAELSSVKNYAGLEYIWQADKSVWPRHAPVLFPIVGKLKDNCCSINNNNYELNQHGFARDSVFSLVSHSNTSCTFELTSNEESRQKFPFDFIFQVSYELDSDTLHTRYKIINPSEQALLFSVGAHPGFNCPLETNESFEDYYLKFEKTNLTITELNGGLLSEQRIPLQLEEDELRLNSRTFDEDALVFENNQINTISLLSKRSNHKIQLDCKHWPYFGIWSKKGCTQFICLEPWYGVADKENTQHVFAEKAGLIKLEAKKQFDCSFSITFA